MLYSLIAAIAIGTVQPAPTLVFQQPTQKQVLKDQKLPNDQDLDSFDLPSDPRLRADIDSDIKQGKKTVLEVLKSEKLSTNKEYQDRVQKIGQIIAHIANHNNVIATWGDKRLHPFHYRYNVLQGDDINAFSLPGGYIFVYEGLMKFVESDDELAGVLAHETAHAAFRHVPTLEKEANKNLIIQIPAIIASILTRNGQPMMIGQLASLSNESGWSINAEKAADFGGFQFMEKSPYNPVAMLTFMERLAMKERYLLPFERTLGILQTHPLTPQRAVAMTENLKNAGIPIQRSKASPTFRVILKDGADGAVNAYFDSRKIYTFGGTEAKERAQLAAGRLNEFYDSVPQSFELSSDGSKILWHGKMLINAVPEDAEAAHTTPGQLIEDSLNSIKGTLYSLAYRVWDGF